MDDKKIIDKKEIERIAELAMLELTDKEKVNLAEDFRSILNHMRTLDKFDLSKEEDSLYQKELKTPLRKDKAIKDGTKEVSSSLNMENNFVRVPAVIKE